MCDVAGATRAFTLSTPRSTQMLDDMLQRQMQFRMKLVQPPAPLRDLGPLQLPAESSKMCPPQADLADRSQHPVPSCSPSSTSSDPHADFSQLDVDCLFYVLSKLCPKDVARAACVCRNWHELASVPAVRRASFVSTWNLEDMTGPDPRSWACLQIASLQSFVVRHTVSPGDSLQKIAVQYGVTVTALKRTNNLISEYSHHSRKHLYVTVVVAAGQVEGKVVQCEYDTHSQRDFILILDGDDATQEQLAQRVEMNQMRAAQMQTKIKSMLSRSLGIDEAAVAFYLEEADGDLKKAVQLAREDTNWEQYNGGRRHRVQDT